MTALLQFPDPLLIAAILLAFLLAAWYGGWRWGRRRILAGTETQETKAIDASFALLALLLAFSFSMALAKHDQRRAMVLSESNAIGDFHTCVTLLKDPIRGKLQQEIRGYVRQKLDLADAPSGANFEDAVQEMQRSQARMTELVRAALNEGTPIAVPLASTLNAVTSSHAARVFAFRDRLPWSIVLLLCVSSIFSVTMLGQEQGESPHPHPVATGLFVLLIVLVVYVTLDLNQPTYGLIRVDQDPMQRLQRSIG